MWAAGEPHSENPTLDDFLATVMPYQLVQGGCPCAADMSLPVAELAVERERIALELNWPLGVRHNGLPLFGHGICIPIWTRCTNASAVSIRDKRAHKRR